MDNENPILALQSIPDTLAQEAEQGVGAADGNSPILNTLELAALSDQTSHDADADFTEPALLATPTADLNSGAVPVSTEEKIDQNYELIA